MLCFLSGTCTGTAVTPASPASLCLCLSGVSAWASVRTPVGNPKGSGPTWRTGGCAPPQGVPWLPRLTSLMATASLPCVWASPTRFPALGQVHMGAPSVSAGVPSGNTPEHWEHWPSLPNWLFFRPLPQRVSTAWDESLFGGPDRARKSETASPRRQPWNSGSGVNELIFLFKNLVLDIF